MESQHTPPRLYALELRTARWQEMLNWYRRVLSARCLIRMPGDGYALLDLGGTRLALLRREQIEGDTDGWSLAVEVDQFEPYVAALERAGSPYQPCPADAEGIESIRCTDPDGNRLRLIRWPG